MPDDVRDTFDQIRQHIKWNLRAIFEADHGGNFAAALLIAVACEALSQLLDERADFYLTELLAKRGLRRELAKDVASALRNGVAHVYDTRYVKAGSLRIELIISWGARVHLSRRDDPAGLYLDVRTMADDLRALFEDLRATLPPTGRLPKQWIQSSVDNVDGRHIELWREWLRGGTT